VKQLENVRIIRKLVGNDKGDVREGKEIRKVQQEKISG